MRKGTRKSKDKLEICVSLSPHEIDKIKEGGTIRFLESFNRKLIEIDIKMDSFEENYG